MKDMNKTLILVAVAAALALLAYITAPAPPSVQVHDDRDEPFYPQFTDPLEAASLEVIAYDEQSGAAVPFKVQLDEGKWTIPSHDNYPADGKDRLARTASGIIALRKDVIQSDRAQDHEALGVIDPLDATNPSLEGRGTRVTLRDASDRMLADFVIGKPVPDKQGFRYVRVPDKKRVYAVKADLELSTKFADWIETNLLNMTAFDVTRLDISDYSVDETSGRVDMVGNLLLTRDEQGVWSMFPLPDGEEVDQQQANTLTGYLSRIRITGVRPKPQQLTADLRQREGLSVDLPTRLSLQSKGFFISNDGQLLSNEGEISAGTRDGVYYTLRFGEVLYGEGREISAGLGESAEAGGEGEGTEAPADEEAATGPENRYLFVTASFDESLLPPKPQPPEPNEEGQVGEAAQKAYEAQMRSWEEQASAGREKARRLNDHFAEWYYVISGADFKNIRQDIDKLAKPVVAEEEQAG